MITLILKYQIKNNNFNLLGTIETDVEISNNSRQEAILLCRQREGRYKIEFSDFTLSEIERLQTKEI